jgi:hypothetical protein
LVSPSSFPRLLVLALGCIIVISVVLGLNLVIHNFLQSIQLSFPWLVADVSERSAVLSCAAIETRKVWTFLVSIDVEVRETAGWGDGAKAETKNYKGGLVLRRLT